MFYLPKDKNGNIYLPLSPFGNKASDGGKFYRRKHGIKGASIEAGAIGLIELVVPYNFCKINELELVNCNEGDEVSFKVYDTPTGAISGVANALLNQFGFDVELPNGFYRDHSEYDADLIKDMKIEIAYKNNSASAFIPKGNIVYHEIK